MSALRWGRRVAILAVALGPAVGAQGPPPADQGEPGVFGEEVAVSWVLVPVSVHGRRGLVTDLARDDFRLSVDGEPVAIASFDRSDEAPVSLALLQDLSGSMEHGGKMAASRRALDCLLERARPGDRVAVATFAGHRFDVDVPFTEDLAAAGAAAAAWRGYGLTALHDAVVRVADLAASRARPNVAAVLVTDGVENASRLAPAAARELVRRARVPVYVLGLTPFHRGVAAPSRRGTARGGARADRGRAGARDSPREDSGSEPAADGAERPGSTADGPGGNEPRSPGRRFETLLRRLAEESGGRYFPLPPPFDVEAACVELATEIRSRVVLGFPTTASGEERYREIRVEVAGRAARVRHRAGYLGHPPGGLR